MRDGRRIPRLPILLRQTTTFVFPVGLEAPFPYCWKPTSEYCEYAQIGRLAFWPFSAGFFCLGPSFWGFIVVTSHTLAALSLFSGLAIIDFDVTACHLSVSSTLSRPLAFCSWTYSQILFDFTTDKIFLSELFLNPVGFFPWKSRYVKHTRILA
jgi:hypothetical protein